MARIEVNYRGYRIWPLVSGDLRILAQQQARRELAQIPPPRCLVIRGTEETAREVIDALWAGDPDPLRPFLGYAGNDASVHAWVAAAEAAARCVWSSREVRRATIRRGQDPSRPGVTVTLEAVELLGGRVRLEATWEVGGRLARRVGWHPDTGEERVLEERQALVAAAGIG